MPSSAAGVQQLGAADFAVIGCMLAASACVGLWFRFTGGRQRTTAEFLLAGRDMGVAPVAFSLMATYMSAISVLGLPSETYLHGTQFLAWMLGSPLGALLAARGFLPVFFDMDVATAYEYLERRFGKTTRTVASLMFTLQMIFYMAVVLYAPSLALNAVTGLSTWTSVVSLAVVCTFYCSLGGLKAVLWTDVFQSVLMYVTISAVVVKGTMDAGGNAHVFDIANRGGRIVFFDTSADLTVRYTLWNSVISGFIFGTHTFATNQAQIQRMLSVGNLRKAQIAVLLSVPLILVFNVFCFWDGVVLYANYHDCDPLRHLDSPDQLMPYSILRMFGQVPGLPGLCIAGVFSASLSTVSSAVNSLTAVTMEDFIRPFCSCAKLTESWAAFLAKIIAIGYGGVCLLLTFIVANFRGVLEASNVMFGMIGGPMLGIYTLGMFSTTANEPGTLVGLLVGFAINAWLGFGSYAAKVSIPSLPTSTAGCALSDNSTLLPSADINGTTLLASGLENVIDVLRLTDESEEYVLPIYKMSFVWFPLIGALVVLAVGYVSSFLISFWITTKKPRPETLSPLVRKWYFKTPKATGSQTDVEMKMQKEIH